MEVKKSGFQFSNPSLESLVFEVNQDYQATDKPNVPINILTNVKKANDAPLAEVEVELQLGEDGGNSNMPFFIRVLLKASFKWDDSIQEELLDELLRTNAPALLVSYARPIIANVTGWSGFPLYNLPYIDMSDNQLIGGE